MVVFVHCSNVGRADGLEKLQPFFGDKLKSKLYIFSTVALHLLPDQQRHYSPFRPISSFSSSLFATPLSTETVFFGLQLIIIFIID